jgi:molybdopterin-guanine dinucleotide biosynthesis protein A
MDSASPVGVVLTGGASTRMGTDKALLTVDGVALAVRVAAALTGAGCSRVLCQGGDRQALDSLGLALIPDSNAGSGPLTAIADALAATAPHDVLVCACDLAWLDVATLAAVTRAAGEHGDADVVAARDRHGPHLVSYWRSRSAGPLGDLLGAGVRSYRAALEALDAVLVEVDPDAVRNVNSPGDLPGYR